MQDYLLLFGSIFIQVYPETGTIISRFFFTFYFDLLQLTFFCNRHSNFKEYFFIYLKYHRTRNLFSSVWLIRDVEIMKNAKGINFIKLRLLCFN